RSLGGKMIIVATFTLLFCLLLMIVFSWGALKIYTEAQTKRDAQTHLSHLQQAYQSHTQKLIQGAEELTQQIPLASPGTELPSQVLTQFLQGAFVTLSASDHITTLDLISSDHQFIAGGSPLALADFQSLSFDVFHLMDQTQGAKTVTAILSEK